MRVFALVIGNNDNPDPDKLKNAVADAQAIASVFKRLGYDVAEVYNFMQADVPGIMSKLEAELPKYDASILFYSMPVTVFKLKVRTSYRQLIARYHMLQNMI